MNAPGSWIGTSIEQYLPEKAMRRFIQKRDQHCRFPGCVRNARGCEPDHVIPYSRRTDHDLEPCQSLQTPPPGQTPGRLDPEMTCEGICTWVDPHGRQYATWPKDHHELAA